MQRIRFANQLRGLAALAVACSHLIGVFWAMQDVVAAVTSSPPQGGALPGLFWLVAHPWVNFGPLGVAIFFLISGLVIPFSLEKHSRTTFIIARLLRIYPTYLAALLLELAVLYVAARAWGRPFAFSPSVILSNALLIYDLTGLPSIDLVNWTLSVELKFYLLAVLLAPAIRRGRVVPLIATAVLLCVGNGLIAAGVVGHADAPPSTFSYTFSSHSVCLIFMLMGVAFNFHIRALIDGKRLILTLAVLLCLFLGSWRLSVWSDQYPVVTVNYIYAFCHIFSIIHHSGLRATQPYIGWPSSDQLSFLSFTFIDWVFYPQGFDDLRGFNILCVTDDHRRDRCSYSEYNPFLDRAADNPDWPVGITTQQAATGISQAIFKLRQSLHPTHRLQRSPCALFNPSAPS